MSKQGRLIGRVIATEKDPTTIDKFHFWTDQNEKLNAFDIVKVQHFDGSFTFGVIENISHITDASSFLTNFISSDFGDVDIEEPTFRVGMNYAEAKVTFNEGNLYTPVHNNSKVFLANANEITIALGLSNVKYKLVCGSLKMYEGTKDEITLPVYLNSKFILGPEGAHLNISGISGLAAKTSYAMFLMKAIQDKYISKNEIDSDETVAFVIFNVKGKDLLAIDKKNDFDGDIDIKNKSLAEYEELQLSSEPFKNVKYYVPFYEPTSSKRSTYLTKEMIEENINTGKLKKYKYIFEDDKESIEMLFANVDDPQYTIESIISKIVDEGDRDFKPDDTWSGFLDIVSQKAKGGDNNKQGEILTVSWKRFLRYINKAIKNDDMFANSFNSNNAECRLGGEFKKIKPNDVYVVDIAKLPEDKQAFVFGDSMRTLYNLKLGEFDGEEGVDPPNRLIIFIDELNKYASKDIPKGSPIKRQILEVTERGRSLGIVLFGAEQFRSNIEDRVTGNCSTHAFGRTNSIETSTRDYSSLPTTYKNILTRLDQGDYLIQNPIFKSLLKIHFPLPIYKQFKD